MANGKRTRRARPNRRAEASRVAIPSCAAWFLKELAPFFRRPLPAPRSRRHLRNASIEMLEAMRDFLDETIEWLRHEERSPEMRRIRVQG
jgi:hypothetical protein